MIGAYAIVMIKAVGMGHVKIFDGCGAGLKAGPFNNVYNQSGFCISSSKEIKIRLQHE